MEARAEIQKYFRWFFGSNEKFRICFRDYLTFNERQNLIEEKFVKTNHVHDRGLMRKHDDPISLKKKRNEASTKRIGGFTQR